MPVNDDAAFKIAGWAGLLDRLWRFLASSRLTVILLVWVAAVLALSQLIPQAPLYFEDPLVRSQWLASVPPGVRPIAERLHPLGVFSLLDSVWLRLPLVILLAHSLVMLAHWGPAVWYRVMKTPGKIPPLGESFRLQGDRSEPAEHVRQQLTNRLERAGYRILARAREDSPGQEGDAFVARRWRWSWLALGGTYLGLGLVSAGLILAGWLAQAQELYLAPDGPVTLPLPGGGALNLTLQETMATGNDPLRPATGVAILDASAGERESRRLVLRLHSSRFLGGIWLTLAELGPMAAVTAADEETGETVLLQPFSPRIPAREQVRLPLIGDPETGFAGVPSQNVTLNVTVQESAGYPSSLWETFARDSVQAEGKSPDHVIFMSFFRGAEPQPSQSESLRSGEAVTFEGVRYVVTLEYNARLRLHSTPWWMVIAAGWGMTSLCWITLAITPPVCIQGDVRPAGKGCHIALTVDVLGDKQRCRQELERLSHPTSEMDDQDWTGGRG